MIPQTVSFTGLTVEAEALLFPHRNRKVTLPCPASWSRMEFTADVHVEKLHQRCDSWLAKHINGRWASYVNFITVVIMFEDENDAILFKLMDGEHACLEEQQD